MLHSNTRTTIVRTHQHETFTLIARLCVGWWWFPMVVCGAQRNDTTVCSIDYFLNGRRKYMFHIRFCLADAYSMLHNTHTPCAVYIVTVPNSYQSFSYCERCRIERAWMDVCACVCSYTHAHAQQVDNGETVTNVQNAHVWNEEWYEHSPYYPYRWSEISTLKSIVRAYVFV